MAAARRLLWSPVATGHEDAGPAGHDVPPSADERHKGSEAFCVELQGKLEVITAEAERANERWVRAVTENKSLKSRWADQVFGHERSASARLMTTRRVCDSNSCLSGSITWLFAGSQRTRRSSTRGEPLTVERHSSRYG
jgi:hypothetical protein